MVVPVDATPLDVTVFVPGDIHPAGLALARAKFRTVLPPTSDDQTRLKSLEQCDGIILRLGDITRQDILSAPKLKIISRTGTGCDTIDLSTCKELGVTVTNFPGGNAQSVAELALTLMLVVLRRVKELDSRICSGEQVPSFNVLSPGLLGRTVGLIGMGDTAYQLALLLIPFHVTIVVYSPSSPANTWSGENPRYPKTIPHRRATSLNDLLSSVDVLSLHCPFTPKTANMIGTEELNRMKPGAVLINTARGQLVDESALIRALKDGHIAGAGLDVFATEPAFGDNLGDLGKMENVVCLPHVGGSTEGVVFKASQVAVEIMEEFFRGKAARNKVV